MYNIFLSISDSKLHTQFCAFFQLTIYILEIVAYYYIKSFSFIFMAAKYSIKYVY